MLPIERRDGVDYLVPPGCRLAGPIGGGIRLVATGGVYGVPLAPTVIRHEGHAYVVPQGMHLRAEGGFIRMAGKADADGDSSWDGRAPVMLGYAVASGSDEKLTKENRRLARDLVQANADLVQAKREAKDAEAAAAALRADLEMHRAAGNDLADVVQRACDAVGLDEAAPSDDVAAAVERIAREHAVMSVRMDSIARLAGVETPHPDAGHSLLPAGYPRDQGYHVNAIDLNSHPIQADPSGQSRGMGPDFGPGWCSPELAAVLFGNPVPAAVARDAVSAKEGECKALHGEVERLNVLVAWLVSWDTCRSSKAIVKATLGIELDLVGYPLDDADRGRCIRLLVKTSWCWDGLAKLAAASGAWSLHRTKIVTAMREAGYWVPESVA